MKCIRLTFSHHCARALSLTSHTLSHPHTQTHTLSFSHIHTPFFVLFLLTLIKRTWWRSCPGDDYRILFKEHCGWSCCRRRNRGLNIATQLVWWSEVKERKSEKEKKEVPDRCLSGRQNKRPFSSEDLRRHLTPGYDACDVGFNCKLSEDQDPDPGGYKTTRRRHHPMNSGANASTSYTEPSDRRRNSVKHGERA